MKHTHIKIEQGLGGDEPRSFRDILLKMYTNWASTNGLNYTIQEEDAFVIVNILLSVNLARGDRFDEKFGGNKAIRFGNDNQ